MVIIMSAHRLLLADDIYPCQVICRGALAAQLVLAVGGYMGMSVCSLFVFGHLPVFATPPRWQAEVTLHLATTKSHANFPSATCWDCFT